MSEFKLSFPEIKQTYSLMDFQRSKKGVIKQIVGNIVTAILNPKFCKAKKIYTGQIFYDTFSKEVKFQGIITGERNIKPDQIRLGDINLFSINGSVLQLSPTSFQLERELQVLVEKNMCTFFGVTFLQSEFSIPNGRIDSLGIDENYCPVIFEYKRNQNENVINQGLFYLDWLMDHKAEFKLLTIEKLGMDIANKIDWSIPCVICIASDFTKFDEHAVNQMQKNIRLIKYKKFGDGLILFEQINAPEVKPILDSSSDTSQIKKTADKTFVEQLAGTSSELREIYYEIRDYILSLGNDVSENQLKLYCAYKKIKNIVCVEIRQKSILLYMRLDPDNLPEEQSKGILRDVRNIGHWGTGDTEVTIKNAKDFESIKYLIDMCYNEN